VTRDSVHCIEVGGREPPFDPGTQTTVGDVVYYVYTDGSEEQIDSILRVEEKAK
jgi:hypothetical protein